MKRATTLLRTRWARLVAFSVVAAALFGVLFDSVEAVGEDALRVAFAWAAALLVAVVVDAIRGVVVDQFAPVDVDGGNTHDSADEGPSRLASALLAEAKRFQEEGRHYALIELRNWASRPLHLIGAHNVRSEIGRLALRAAERTGDRMTQASILIDDLGWAVTRTGDAKKAEDNIRDGLAIAEALVADAGENKQQATQLAIKARRHLAGIYATSDLDVAQEYLDEANALADQLPASMAEAEKQATEAGRAWVLNEHVEGAIGEPHARIDPSSDYYDLLTTASTLSASAVRYYRKLGDTTRAAKEAAIRLRIVRKIGTERQISQAEADLENLEERVSRELKPYKS